MRSETCADTVTHRLQMSGPTVISYMYAVVVGLTNWECGKGAGFARYRGQGPVVRRPFSLNGG